MSYLLFYYIHIHYSLLHFRRIWGTEMVYRWFFFSEDYKDSSSGIFPIDKGQDTHEYISQRTQQGQMGPSEQGTC